MSGETYHLVKKLQKEKLNESYEFSFIIGLDNANTFNKWVNYSYLERSIAFTVVNRLGVTRDPKVTWYLNHPHTFLQAENEIPEISSSQIRIELQKFWSDGNTSDILKQNLAPSVLDYIKVHKLYQAPPNKQH
jgi:nicotinic acid mononucleotide adenylyltransferase